jgi:hypothetical protein
MLHELGNVTVDRAPVITVIAAGSSLLEDLAKIAAIDPAAARGTLDEMLGLVEADRRDAS